MFCNRQLEQFVVREIRPYFSRLLNGDFQLSLATETGNGGSLQGFVEYCGQTIHKFCLWAIKRSHPARARLTVMANSSSLKGL